MFSTIYCFTTLLADKRKNTRVSLQIGLATLLIVATASAHTQAQARFTIDDFNKGATETYAYTFQYGGLNNSGRFDDTTYDIKGIGNGGVGWGYNPAFVDLTAYATGNFVVDAKLLPGNQNDLDILVDVVDSGPADNYMYYYRLNASGLNSTSFSSAFTKALNNPDFVLDSANGYKFVGVGNAFAPNLAKVVTIQIQGASFDSTKAINYRFDNFAIRAAAVPEPGTLALLLGVGVSGTGFVLRRRRK